jgi:cell division septum initiation protein DivIVA
MRGTHPRPRRGAWGDVGGDGVSETRLTPEYLQSVSFPAARLGKRGVDEAHVRVFCEWVQSELARLLSEKAELEQELRRLRDREREAGTVQPDENHVQATFILSRAQQTADRYVANAQEYSRDIAEDARRRREEILSEAKMRASVILDQAHTRVTNSAAPPADADMLPAPVAHEPMSAARRQELETELAYLRTFSNACRMHLRAHLESLTRSIDEWEQAEDALPPDGTVITEG